MSVPLDVPVPMFPLGSVLLPGMVLPLHVFEERYRLAALGVTLLALGPLLILIALAVETPRFDPDPRFWAAFLWQIAGPGLAAAHGV